MKGQPRSRQRGNPIRAGVLKSTFGVSNIALNTGSSGASGSAWASVALRGLPEGNILILGAVANLQFTTADANVIAAWTGSFSIGTAATADATLNGNEINIVQSTTLSAATAKVSPVTRGTSSGATIPIDNTDRTLSMQLNLVIDDASISGNNVAVTGAGFVSIAYVVLGDD